MRHAEDFAVGERQELGSRVLTAEEVKAFAADWDPMPFHLSDEAAAAGPFGELVASGLHSIAVFTRLFADGITSRSAVIAGRGVDRVRLRRPVRPGVELTAAATVAHVELREDGRGVVRWSGELRDGAGELLLTLEIEGLVRRRQDVRRSA